MEKDVDEQQKADDQSVDEAAPKAEPPKKRKPVTAKRLLRWLLVLIVTTTVLVVGSFWGSGAWIRDQADPWVFATFEAVPARAVAIVPGAHVDPGGSPSAVLEDRLQTARQLYVRGKVRRILVSGDNRSRYYNEPAAMRAWLLKRDIPPAHVTADFAGLRTLDTMERAARVFQVRGAIVCTQAFHLHRSVFLARQAGIDAVGLISDRRAYHRDYRDRSREYFARSLAFLDVYFLGTEPRHLGPTIPILSADEAAQSSKSQN